MRRTAARPGRPAQRAGGTRRLGPGHRREALACSTVSQDPQFLPDAITLESDPEVGQFRKSAYRRAIMGYLKHLKDAHLRASLASAKAYFDAEKEAGHDRVEEREAVRWFFRAARRVGMSNIQHGMSNDEGGEGRPDSQHGMSKEDKGEGGTLNAERSTPNAAL